MANKKRNTLKRNSGFIVLCVLAAGVSAFAADSFMTGRIEIPSMTEASETVEETMAETLAPETTIQKTYETDAFTVTATGNILKGAETEKETEKQKKETKESESENLTPETDADGNVIERTDSSQQEAGTSETMDSMYLDLSGSGGSEAGQAGNNSYQGNGYDGQAIVIYDSGNGDYYYSDQGNGYTPGTQGTTGNTQGGDPAKYTDFWSSSVMPQTYSTYITREELSQFNAKEIRLIRNEIFARHGRIFTVPDLAEYFAAKSWYVPLYSGAFFDNQMSSYLTEYERANLQLILDYEDEMARN